MPSQIGYLKLIAFVPADILVLTGSRRAVILSHVALGIVVAERMRVTANTGTGDRVVPGSGRATAIAIAGNIDIRRHRTSTPSILK